MNELIIFLIDLNGKINPCIYTATSENRKWKLPKTIPTNQEIN